MGRTSEGHTAAVEGCYQRSTCHCFRKEKELELWKYPSLHATQQPNTPPHRTHGNTPSTEQDDIKSQ